jgi:hypothetical protein
MRKYTEGPGTQFNEGSVNFNLEYVPFNETTPGAWAKWEKDSNYTLGGETGRPVWIIRSGLNDEAQNEKTAFDTRTDDSNGNGASAFKVKHRYWAANPSGTIWGEPELPYDMLKLDGGYCFTDFPEYEGAYNTWVTKSRDSLGGYVLKVGSVWDDYKRDSYLDREVGGGLLEWEIDWGTEESPKSGIEPIRISWADSIERWVSAGPIRPDVDGGVTRETLTIIRDADGKQKLNFTGKFTESIVGEDNTKIPARYAITLRGRLEKGFKGHTADIVDMKAQGGGVYISLGPRTFKDGQDYTGSIITYWEPKKPTEEQEEE